MMKKSTMAIMAAVLTLGMSGAALADECSGRDHTSGTLLGALGGGLIGGLASHGNGLGIIGGAILGGFAGNAISRDMDCDDRPYAARSYERSFSGPVGRRYDWNRGPDRGYVVSDREFRQGPRLCRDFTQVVYRHGRQFVRHGTACRRRNGAWEFV